MTLDKEGMFIECRILDTRQRSQHLYVLGQSLPSVQYLTLGKNGRFAECPGVLRASVSALGKVFAECPIENIWQRGVCRHCRCRVLFVECYARQIFCRVFFDLCRVPVAHGKLTVSGSALRERDPSYALHQQPLEI